MKFPKKLVSLKKLFSSVKNPVRYSEYIYSHLYDKEKGYFQNSAHNQLGRLEEYIEFSKLLGFSDFSVLLAEKYPQNKFLTPSEIFRPFYGMTIANMMIKQLEKVKSEKMRVVEVGSGLGGNVLSILGYLKQFHPKLYVKVDFSLVEISKDSLEKSRKLISNLHPGLVGNNQIKFYNQDIFDSEIKSNDLVFVLFLEILDNLTHEKIIVNSQCEEPRQVWVDFDGETGLPKEVLKDLQDKDVVNLFEFWKSMRFKKGKFLNPTLRNQKITDYFKRKISDLTKKDFAVHLPIGFYRILNKLAKDLPQCSLFVSDFSTLPIPVNLSSRFKDVNAPIISKKLEKAHEVENYDSVFQSEFGRCDVFYPTDFEFVKSLIQSSLQRDYLVRNPQEFFKLFSEPSWGETKCGYNPMISYFGNVRFLSEK